LEAPWRSGEAQRKEKRVRGWQAGEDGSAWIVRNGEGMNRQAGGPIA